MIALYYLSAAILGFTLGIGINLLTRPLYDKLRKKLLPKWYLEE